MKGIAFAKRNVVMAPKWEVGTDHRGLRTGGATGGGRRGPPCAREPRSFRDQPGLSAGSWSKPALTAAIQPAQLLRVNDSHTTTHMKSPNRLAGEVELVV